MSGGGDSLWSALRAAVGAWSVAGAGATALLLALVPLPWIGVVIEEDDRITGTIRDLIGPWLARGSVAVAVVGLALWLVAITADVDAQDRGLRALAGVVPVTALIAGLIILGRLSELRAA